MKITQSHALRLALQFWPALTYTWSLTVKRLLRFVWVIAVFPGMRGHGLGLRFQDMTGFANFAVEVHWVMSDTLSLSVQKICASGSNGLTCLRGRRQCKHSCGRRT